MDCEVVARDSSGICALKSAQTRPDEIAFGARKEGGSRQPTFRHPAHAGPLYHRVLPAVSKRLTNTSAGKWRAASGRMSARTILFKEIVGSFEEAPMDIALPGRGGDFVRGVKSKAARQQIFNIPILVAPVSLLLMPATAITDGTQKRGQYARLITITVSSSISSDSLRQGRLAAVAFAWWVSPAAVRADADL